MKQKHWLLSRGKSHLFKFTDQEIREIKQYFITLDADGGGTIGVEELEVPLISLGIAKSPEDVEDIVNDLDDDGEISFEEFLQILCMGDTSKNTSGLINFFKGFFTHFFS